jgi:hypothetical protein
LVPDPVPPNPDAPQALEPQYDALAEQLAGSHVSVAKFQVGRLRFLLPVAAAAVC